VSFFECYKFTILQCLPGHHFNAPYSLTSSAAVVADSGSYKNCKRCSLTCQFLCFELLCFSFLLLWKVLSPLECSIHQLPYFLVLASFNTRNLSYLVPSCCSLSFLLTMHCTFEHCSFLSFVSYSFACLSPILAHSAFGLCRSICFAV